MSLISRRFHDFSDHEQFYDCGTIILYDICITKFVNPSSAGDFPCSAGELGIESESWRLGIYAIEIAFFAVLTVLSDSILGDVLIHSQSSRESFPGLCKNYAARKRVFSVSLRFAPFILPVFMGWGKRQIPLISPWLASVILQNFEFPHPFPSNSKQCREFSPAQGQRSQFIPLYSPTYSPGWPGVLPQGQADDMCITSTESFKRHALILSRPNALLVFKSLMDLETKSSLIG